MRDLSKVIYEDRISTTFILSDTEVGKIMREFKIVWTDRAGNVADMSDLIREPTLENEANMLMFANTVNDLFPKFYGFEEVEYEGSIEKMIVMERLHPLPFNHFDPATREEMFEVLRGKLYQLHEKFFIHGDLVPPARYVGRDMMFNNLVQTETGIRLRNTTFSHCLHKNEENVERFFRGLHREKHELLDFKYFYLYEEYGVR